jgi:hypothetical protein
MRSGLSLVKEGTSWHIEGDGRDRARIAYATIVDGKLAYEFEPIVEDVPCQVS